jgi:hypothetical protein
LLDNDSRGATMQRVINQCLATYKTYTPEQRVLLGSLCRRIAKRSFYPRWKDPEHRQEITTRSPDRWSLPGVAPAKKGHTRRGRDTVPPRNVGRQRASLDSNIRTWKVTKCTLAANLHTMVTQTADVCRAQQHKWT